MIVSSFLSLLSFFPIFFPLFSGAEEQPTKLRKEAEEAVDIEENPPSNMLFVAGLPPQVTELMVQNMFQL